MVNPSGRNKYVQCSTLPLTDQPVYIQKGQNNQRNLVSLWKGTSIMCSIMHSSSNSGTNCTEQGIQRLLKSFAGPWRLPLLQFLFQVWNEGLNTTHHRCSLCAAWRRCSAEGRFHLSRLCHRSDSRGLEVDAKREVRLLQKAHIF